MGTSDRSLHQHVLAGMQCGERNDQFGQVPQGSVEQPADSIASAMCDGLGGEA